MVGRGCRIYSSAEAIEVVVVVDYEVFVAVVKVDAVGERILLDEVFAPVDAYLIETEASVGGEGVRCRDLKGERVVGGDNEARHGGLVMVVGRGYDNDEG